MNISKLTLIGLMLLSLVGVGCATSKDGDVYSRDQSQKIQTVETGKLIDIRTVKIEGTKSSIGTIGGGVIGGIAGSTVGGGRGSAIAAAVGAIVGGIAGSAVEEGTTRQDGVELTIELDSGKVIALVQGFEHESEFMVNDRVRVLHSGRESRVYRVGSE
ncbi:MAG: glycine zipper 2TM domain-containing protein [Thiotrichaceae bacterium]|nr:glycine zipper 2TM domain-containing protein [Thiotrichaceae bacterium]